MKKKLFCCFLMAASVLAVAGQTVHTTVDKKDILIGQRITYTMSVALPSPQFNVSLVIPDSVPHFDVITKGVGGSTNKQGQYSWHNQIIFTSFDSGSWNFPALQYRINHLNTASQALYTDSFRVNVGYMPLDKSGQPRDIKSVIEVDYFDWFWIYLAAGILAALIILFFVIRYFIRKRRKVPDFAHSSSLSAYDEAIKALAELREKNAKQSVPIKDFYTSLADVFKRYYGRKSNRDLSNFTTGDILLKLKEYELSAVSAQSAATALNTSDAVKFAKYNPTFTENEAAMDYVKSAVDDIEKASAPNTIAP